MAKSDLCIIIPVRPHVLHQGVCGREAGVGCAGGGADQGCLPAAGVMT